MAEQYTLKVVIDDSKIRELEQRLGKLGGGSGGGQGSKGGGGLAGLMGGGGSTGGTMKNIAKLGIIAIGVGAIMKAVQKITSLMIQSSPMLSGMLKLFNTSILMIFRPIGDFVGFFLRPIMIFLLRNIALPWYRMAAPIMRQWGSAIGNNLVNFIKDPLGGLANLITSINWWDLLKFSPVLVALEAIRSLAGLFNIDLGNIASGISEQFTNLISGVTNVLSPVFENFTNGISMMFNDAINFLSPVFTGLSDGLGFIFDEFIGWWDQWSTWISTSIGASFGVLIETFANIWNDITTTLQPAWDAIEGFIATITDIWEKIIGWLQPLWDVINNFFNIDGSRESTSFSDTNPRSQRGGGEMTVIVVQSDGTEVAGSVDNINPSALEHIQRRTRNRRG